MQTEHMVLVPSLQLLWLLGTARSLTSPGLQRSQVHPVIASEFDLMKITLRHALGWLESQKKLLVVVFFNRSIGEL